jgi:peptidoglycan/xylan/chitin deacetylase (PgdA/CDA1 family)
MSAPAAVSITFDNLGEAAELELGVWPADRPLGSHFSVQEALPRVLELLASLSIRATFFVEGLNAELYPDALRSIADHGHEVAAHAWRHEQWGILDHDTEAELMARATGALRALGLAPTGFRPPGGGLTDRTPALLQASGYSYVSPEGDRESVGQGLAFLPFRWPLVDAFSFMPQLADMREEMFGSRDPFGPERVSALMREALHEHAGRGGHLSLIFHPFAVAAGGEPGWTALEEVLSTAVEMAREGRLSLVRMDEAAQRMVAG